jgi:hypothetical protein
MYYTTSYTTNHSTECDLELCDDCDAGFHKTGKTKNHVRERVSVQTVKEDAAAVAAAAAEEAR